MHSIAVERSMSSVRAFHGDEQLKSICAASSLIQQETIASLARHLETVLRSALPLHRVDIRDIIESF